MAPYGAAEIRLLLNSHSAHISREARDYLDSVPPRFVFVFTPTHGSWLNLVENLFSEMTRSMLRGIRVASKQELIDRRSPSAEKGREECRLSG